MPCDAVCLSRFLEWGNMDGLTAFGLLAVTTMLVFYALENRSHWFILAFAGSCVLSSIYGFLQGAWPFGGVEAVWSVVAIRRWWLAKHFNVAAEQHRLEKRNYSGQALR